MKIFLLFCGQEYSQCLNGYPKTVCFSGPSEVFVRCSRKRSLHCPDIVLILCVRIHKQVFAFSGSEWYVVIWCSMKKRSRLPKTELSQYLYEYLYDGPCDSGLGGVPSVCAFSYLALIELELQGAYSLVRRSQQTLGGPQGKEDSRSVMWWRQIHVAISVALSAENISG